jgi:diguanylate cyclase (GGDEF)-like protein
MVTPLAVVPLCAQRYTFRQYGPADGLSNLSINCLLQDRTGFIWAGTDNGLFRFDGHRFQSFGDADGLPSSEILDLAESSDGVLWVATQSGVARQAGTRFEAVDVGKQGQIHSIAFDRLGRIYLEHISGIVRGDPNGAGQYRFSTVAPGAVSGLFVKGEDVWFGKDGDLWHLTGDRTERIGSSAGLPADLWEAIAQDSLGNLWARSATRLYELARGQTRFANRSEAIPHSSNSRLYADRHGTLFISTDAGAVRLAGANRTYIDAQHGLPTGSIRPILMDRDESLWLGGLGGGLLRAFGHGEWLSWKKEDGLLHNTVWSILHDRAGQLWVGTTGGLSIFAKSGRLVHSWSSRNGLAGDQVFSIIEGPAGDVFANTFPAGISRFSKDGVFLRTYGAESGLKIQRLRVIRVDRQGRLWAIGFGSCFRSKAPLNASGELKFERIPIPDVLSQTLFRDALVDEAGVVWLASSNGLARFDGRNWRVFTKADGLKSETLDSLAQGKGEILIGYRDALGITRFRFDGERVQTTHFTEKDGLSSDQIYGLGLDREGRLWASTDNGANRLEKGVWHHYGIEDGLIWDDCDDRALYIDREDNVWIGTSGGLSRFASPPYPIPDSPPPVVLTSIKVGTQEFRTGDRPVLSYEQNSILIQFSGLNYSLESRTRFRYRLRGYENLWNETRERDVHYAGLPGGRYTFEVMAAGPNGQWSTVPAQFVFSVKPPWWLTWWFMVGCLTMLLLIARAIWRFRVRVLMAQKQQLEQQVAARTAELIESHRMLEEIAYLDVLTSLPNRRMFTERFRAQIKLASRDGRPFVLLLVDLDHFKQINDTFGHDAGDAVLVETAIRLRGAIRESDCAARMGGDEFAILAVSAHDAADIEVVCNRIIAAFAAGIPFKGMTLQVKCSVGVARFPDDGDTHEDLLKSADISLYEAKQAGRNSFCWHHSENPPIAEVNHGN